MKMSDRERTETTDLEHLIFRDKMDDRFSKALSKLPEDFRTVVLLCDVDGFTYEEISNMLDVPIGTIRSRLHRGRNLLKNRIVRACQETRVHRRLACTNNLSWKVSTLV